MKPSSDGWSSIPKPKTATAAIPQTLNGEVSNVKEKLCLSVDGVASELGVSRQLVYGMINDRLLLARKLSNRTIVLRSDLHAFLAALPLAVNNKSNVAANDGWRGK